MDHKLFLEKLSEVADWEYRNVQGLTNHNYRAEESEVETPKEVVIKRLKNAKCQVNDHYHTLVKPYTYMRKTFYVERCPSCGMAKTKNSDWFKIDHISYIASQAYYKEFGGEPKAYNKFSTGTFMSQDGEYEVIESGSGVIRRLVDK